VNLQEVFANLSDFAKRFCEFAKVCKKRFEIRPVESGENLTNFCEFAKRFCEFFKRFCEFAKTLVNL
jgi:hypothetical protein